MSIRRVSALLALCLALAWAVPPASADEAAERGRAIFEQNRDAVVTVQAVLSMSMGGGEREDEKEANGTVLTPDGLTVLSLTALDPTVMMQRLHGERGEMVSKVTNLKLILADGSELDGEVVLRDRDLDLVFVRPTEAPDAPMTHVDLERIGEAELLDELVFIGQLGRVVRRAHFVFIERVMAVVERPLKFYIVGEDRSQAVACSPAFTLDGEFVGIGVLRAIRSGTGGGLSGNPMVIIAVAEDIRIAMEQVPDRDED